MTDGEPTRRRFLSWCTLALLTLLGLLVAVPVFGYFLAPLWKREQEGGGPAFVDAGPLADLPLGQWILRTLEVVRQDGWRRARTRHAIWVRRQGEGAGSLHVLSAICPHLGCPIGWHREQREFLCPCHGGTFDSTGQRIAGPPPRSMDPLPFEVRAGHLWVRWQDFKIGVAERLPVSA